MPAGSAEAPGALPAGLAGFAGFPEGKVLLALFGRGPVVLFDRAGEGGGFIGGQCAFAVGEEVVVATVPGLEFGVLMASALVGGDVEVY